MTVTLLSRNDTATITSGEWVAQPAQPPNWTRIQWWTVTTDRTGDRRFRIVGWQPSPAEHEPRLRGWWERYDVGRPIRLGSLSGVPVPDGLMAYAETGSGPVLATIGRVRDQLEDVCGPIAYLVPRANTRQDTVDPTPEQMDALWAALVTLMTDGPDAAMSELHESGLFRRVWRDGEGCPVAPTKLVDGAFEWLG